MVVDSDSTTAQTHLLVREQIQRLFQVLLLELNLPREYIPAKNIISYAHHRQSKVLRGSFTSNSRTYLMVAAQDLAANTSV